MRFHSVRVVDEVFLSGKPPNPPQSYKEGETLHFPLPPFPWYWLPGSHLPFFQKEVRLGKDRSQSAAGIMVGWIRLSLGNPPGYINFKGRAPIYMWDTWFDIGKPKFEHENNSLMRLLLTSQSKLPWSHPTSLILLLFHFIRSIYHNLQWSLVYVLITSFFSLECKPLKRKDLPRLVYPYITII